MTVAVIGAGIIGSAIVKSLLQSGYKGKIIATRRRLEAIRNFEKLGVDITDDNKKAAKEADIIVLCVKPKDIEKVLEEIQN
ncbi:MAG: NAD(P)-binding domain-containing protein, partial [Candidatus Bathyarchaeia archaeon]